MPDLHNNPVEALWVALEQLADEHEELTDTDVREALHLTLNYFYVWGKESDRLPITYGMFSLEGDQAVAQAVDKFLTAVHANPEAVNLPVGKSRLDFLQNSNIETPGGSQYDEFIGYSDDPLPPDPLPEYMFRENDYDY